MINITNSTRILILALTTLCSIQKITANTNALTMPPQVQQETQELESLYKKSLAQLSTLDLTLEELALLTHNTSATLVRKTANLDGIKAMRMLIGQLKEATLVTVDLRSLTLLLTFNELIIDHVRTGIAQGFNAEALSQWETVLAEAIKADTNLNDLAKKAAANERQLLSLIAESKNVGLTWYNKTYRTFDNYLFQPWQKYHLGTYVKIATLAAASAVLLWWATDSENTTMRKWLGWKPVYNQLGVVQENTAKPLGILGKANVFINEHVSGRMPVNSFVWGLLAASAAPELSAAASYSGKKFNNAINFLKGGAYQGKKDEFNKTLPKVTLKDIIGLEPIKKTFGQIVKYLEDPERFDRSKLTPEKGFLLTGPTRTGKTFSAEALAGEIKEMYKRTGRDPEDFNFIVLKASFIKEQGIRWIFQKAQEIAPCILFIDEIDLLQLQRTGNTDLLSEFLQSMSGCLEKNDPRKPVILIAATNRSENIEGALKQRGRFGTEIRFEYPSALDRQVFITQKLMTFSVDQRNFAIESLVRETERASYEDLTAMMRSAFIDANSNGQTLTQAHLEHALDKEVRHIDFDRNNCIPKDEERIVAIHQAGKALATVLLASTQKLAKVMILPYKPVLIEESPWHQYWVSEEEKQKKIMYGYCYTYHEEDTYNMYSRDEKIKQCKLQLAGHSAEKIILGSSGFSYNREDARRAFEIAKSLTFEGLDVENFPNEIKAHYLNQALALKKQCDDEIFNLLTSHKETLEKIVAALLEKKILTRHELEALINPTESRDDATLIANDLGIKETKHNESSI